MLDMVGIDGSISGMWAMMVVWCTVLMLVDYAHVVVTTMVVC